MLGIIDGPGGLDSGDGTIFGQVKIHIPVSHQIKTVNGFSTKRIKYLMNILFPPKTAPNTRDTL
jgi:hypothetical protein